MYNEQHTTSRMDIQQLKFFVTPLNNHLILQIIVFFPFEYPAFVMFLHNLTGCNDTPLNYQPDPW